MHLPLDQPITGTESLAMKIDDHTFRTDSQVFLEKMADYFANIDAHMNKEIFKPTNSTIKIYSQQCLQSCVLHKITDEISGSIDCVKVHSSQGFDQGDYICF